MNNDIKYTELNQAISLLTFAKAFLFLIYKNDYSREEVQFNFIGIKFDSGLNMFAPMKQTNDSQLFNKQYFTYDCNNSYEEFSLQDKMCNIQHPLIFYQNDSNIYNGYEFGMSLGSGYEQINETKLNLYGISNLKKITQQLNEFISKNGQLYITLINDENKKLLYSSKQNLNNKTLFQALDLDEISTKKYKQQLQNVIKDYKALNVSNFDCTLWNLGYNFSTQTEQSPLWTIIIPANILHHTAQYKSHCHNQLLIIYNIKENNLLERLTDTFSKVQYVKFITFGVILLISIFTSLILFRYVILLTFSFENPISMITTYMKEIQIKLDDLDQQETVNNFEKYFTSAEIRALFEAIITLITNVKYSNQRFLNDDALALLELSKAKKFYNEIDNLNAVGICCNNIGNIHLKQERYLEAVAEYQEAILMAKIERKEAKSAFKKLRLSVDQQSNKVDKDDPQQQSPLKDKKSMFNTTNKSKNNKLIMKNPQIISPLKPAGSNQANNQGQKSKSGEPSQIQIEQSNQKLIKLVNSTQNQNDNNNQDNEPILVPYKPNFNDKNLILESSSNNFNQDHLVGSQYQYNENNDIELRYYLSLARLLSRKFQLGCALKDYSTKKDVFYYESVRLFDQCMILSNKQKPTELNTKIQILTLNHKAKCLIMLGDIKAADIDIRKASELIATLTDQQAIQQQWFQSNIPQVQDGQMYYPYGEMQQISLDILKGKLKQKKALIEIAHFNFQRAAEYITEILEEGQFYDPSYRLYDLALLQNIFNTFNMQNQDLDQMVSNFDNNTVELIILIDYSKDMSQDQIQLSHITCKAIFEKLQDKDKIGFIVYNDMVHLNFPLQEKKHYKELLEKKLRSIPISPGGKSDMFLALKVATGIFDKQSSVIIDNNSNQNSQNKLRYICLFTEGSNPLREDQHDQLQSLLDQKNIHILIFKIQQQNAHMLYLMCFASITKSSQFIVSEKDIDTFLKKCREKFQQHKLIYEQF